jgi:hypothetical protein
MKYEIKYDRRGKNYWNLLNSWLISISSPFFWCCSDNWLKKMKIKEYITRGEKRILGPRRIHRSKKMQKSGS